MNLFNVSRHVRIGALLLTSALVSINTLATPVVITNGNLQQKSGSVPTGWTAIDGTGEGLWNFGSASPAGGNFWGIQSLAGWGSRHNKGGIFQTIGDLTIGASYALTFYSMASHTNSSQTEYWQVSFGDQTLDGAVVDAAKPTWAKSVLEFIATSTSQTLKFAGVFLNTTPGVSPEILNLDGISLELTALPPTPLKSEPPIAPKSGPGNDVPEPASLGLMLAGIGALAWAQRRRRKQSEVAPA